MIRRDDVILFLAGRRRKKEKKRKKEKSNDFPGDRPPENRDNTEDKNDVIVIILQHR